MKIPQRYFQVCYWQLASVHEPKLLQVVGRCAGKHCKVTFSPANYSCVGVFLKEKKKEVDKMEEKRYLISEKFYVF